MISTRGLQGYVGINGFRGALLFFVEFGGQDEFFVKGTMAIIGLMGLLSWVPRVSCMGAHIGICCFFTFAGF